MGFFARACVEALQDIPQINARIDGDSIIYSKRVHLGIAASTPRGLVVPVVRNAELLDLPEIEREIARLAGVARENKLAVSDLTGGTFTLSNGGSGTLSREPATQSRETRGGPGKRVGGNGGAGVWHAKRETGAASKDA